MPDQSMPSSDTAVVPEPGYYPDPSVPGFVRYWNGGAWVPGTSRPAPAAGEVLAAPRFAARAAAGPVGGRYIPPPVVVREPVAEPAPAVVAGPETGPVFLDETAAGAVLIRGEETGLRPGWADPRAQPGLLETGGVSRVSWGAAAPPVAEPVPAAPVEPFVESRIEPRVESRVESRIDPLVDPAPAAVPAPAVHAPVVPAPASA
ncbi:DUF2510 domain-containing protein, partial [Kitasatospora sp. NPDC058965]|uniref:DUF2510 domain-containing protein n=1 Tax=Kitasatospora sp. NPDC058965 TaxID=3346682 RepID=UPI0036C7C878